MKTPLMKRKSPKPLPSVNVKGVDIRFDPNGTLSVEWRTDEVAAIACALCGHYGWQKYGPTSIFDTEEMGPCRGCPMRQPYCG